MHYLTEFEEVFGLQFILQYVHLHVAYLKYCKSGLQSY